MAAPPKALGHLLFVEHAAALDRYQALLEEDGALRESEYRHPDPARRRLKVACNDCQTPWCCNQRVEVDFVEALALYRWAAAHARPQLDAAIARGRRNHELRRPVTDAEFFHRREPCPFLVRGRCSVYPVRPHPCRTHYMAGNPLKCRDELAPSETYAMDPDRAIVEELRALAADVRFFALIEGVEPTELAEVLYFIDRLPQAKPWTAPRPIGWELVGDVAPPPATKPRRRR